MHWYTFPLSLIVILWRNYCINIFKDKRFTCIIKRISRNEINTHWNIIQSWSTSEEPRKIGLKKSNAIKSRKKWHLLRQTTPHFMRVFWCTGHQLKVLCRIKQCPLHDGVQVNCPSAIADSMARNQTDAKNKNTADNAWSQLVKKSISSPQPTIPHNAHLLFHNYCSRKWHQDDDAKTRNESK